ncbi:MAG: amidohydrolase family protein [Deltaproteobacteria bacterium]|nr:amidohydrolase family protein [Deltaproteobacteria bacterium]
MPPLALRPRRVVLAALAGAVLVSGGCVQLRRFVVPPPDPSREGMVGKDSQPTRPLADTVVVVGHLAGHPDGRAIALRAGEVIALGTPAEVTPVQGPTTHVVKASQAWATQGLVDAHVHLEGSAMRADAADLSQVTDGNGLESAVRLARPTMTNWLWGYGLSQAAFDSLDAAEVDAALDDTPAYLSRADGHGALLTSALLEQLPRDLGQRVRQAGNKVEGPLASQVWRALPPWPLARLRPLLRQQLLQFERRGVTEVHAIGESQALLDTLYSLEAAGQLAVRVRLYLDAERPEGHALLAGKYQRVASRAVVVAGVKLWLDGTLAARSAALLQPYSDKPEHKGSLAYTDEQVAQTLQQADRQGVQLAVHAIGDAAVEQILRVSEGRHRDAGALAIRIEHAQVVAPNQLPRLKAGRFECSVQPRHREADASFALARLGAERMQWAYRGLALAEVCPVRSGSDVPVVPTDPLGDLKVMLTTPAEQQAGPARSVPELAWQALGPYGTRQAPRPLRLGDRTDLVLWSADPRDPALGAVPQWTIIRGVVRQIVPE